MNGKPAISSKTIQGVLAGIIPLVYAVKGMPAPPPDATQFLGLSMDQVSTLVVGLITAIYSIIGRLTAKEDVTSVVKKKK